MNYLIGTRGSQLSLAQTKWVISELKKVDPDADFEIVTIKTKGDTDARPLFTINQKGIFEKEVDRAVSEKKVDFAVHSLKDVPSMLAEDLVLASVPKREDVNDIFISKNEDTLETLQSGSTVGTSSLRRAVQISKKRPDLKVKPIRGNIETRIQKVKEGEYDAIVLAQAGITRLGIKVNHSKLSIDDFYPSPGQGALAIVCRKDDSEIIDMLKKIQDNNSRLEVEAERELSNYVESGCKFPVGAFAKIQDQQMTLQVVAFSVDGSKSLMVKKTGTANSPELLGKTAGMELEKMGVNELALDWRDKVEEWNQK